MKTKTLLFNEYLDPNINNYDFHWLSTDYPILHNHDFWEITIITDGIFFHDVNNIRHQSSRGDAFLIRSYIDYHSLISSTTNNGRVLNLSIKTSRVKELCSLFSPDFYSSLMKSSLVSLTFSGSKYNMLIEYASALRTAIITNKNRESIANLFFVFILENTFAKFNLEQNNYPDWLVNVLNKINDPKNIDIFAKDIVASTPYSHNYITRNFNKYIGTTIIDYINSIKMNNAIDLILHSDKSMLDISISLGFTSLSHFNHLFKRYYGTSPKAYKQLHKKPDSVKI